MDYRKDARNTCSSCGVAMADDALELDLEGHVLCPDCKAKKTIEAADDRAHEEERKSTNRGPFIALAVLAVAGIVFVLAELPHYQAAGRRKRLFDTRERAQNVLLGAASSKGIEGDRACDDVVLRRNGTIDRKPWLEMSAFAYGAEYPPRKLEKMWGASLLAKNLLYTEMLPAESNDDAFRAADLHLRQMARVRYLIVIEGHKHDTFWSGHARVFDTVEKARLCWVQFGLPLDRAGLYETTAMMHAAQKALETITKAILLEDWFAPP